MKCAKCGVENRETAKFCRDCGAKLEPVSNMAAPVDPDQTVLLNSDDEPADVPAAEHVLQGVVSASRPVASAAAANVCPSCGANTNPGAMFCRKCGKERG